MNNYDDIIHLPRHVSATHPRMSIIERAAQFSPFAALSGYDAAIKETGRLTDRRIELSEEERSILDRKQHYLLEHLSEQPEISVTYFIPDERKSGGAYVTFSGVIKKIDTYRRLMFLTDGTTIPLDDIFHLDSSIFNRID